MAVHYKLYVYISSMFLPVLSVLRIKLPLSVAPGFCTPCLFFICFRPSLVPLQFCLCPNWLLPQQWQFLSSGKFSKSMAFLLCQSCHCNPYGFHPWSKGQICFTNRLPPKKPDIESAPLPSRLSQRGTKLSCPTTVREHVTSSMFQRLTFY